MLNHTNCGQIYQRGHFGSHQWKGYKHRAAFCNRLQKKKTVPYNSRFIQITNLYLTDLICVSCLKLRCAISSIYVITYVLGVRIWLHNHAVCGVTTLNNSLSVSYNILATNRNQGSVVSIVDMLQGLMTKESWFNSWQRQATPPLYRACGLFPRH